MTDREQLIENTKRFVKHHTPGLGACPSLGCKFISRDPEAVCREHGEKVR